VLDPEAAPPLAALLPGWTDGEGPLYRRLAAAVAAAVDDGRLPGGALLPPERHVAAQLAVSRSTVVAAFDLLKAEGHLEARQGSGTWVPARPSTADRSNLALVEALDEHAIVRDLSGAPTGLLELTAAAIDCAPEVLAASTSIDPALLARASDGHGYAPQGLGELREAIAARLTATGLPTTPAQVLVTTGATQALLLAARLYLRPGAPVVVETPTYAGAIDVLSAAGGKLLPVGLDRSGTRVDQLGDILARTLPHLVYLVPDFQNPAGVVLSARRRAEVARLAAEYHVPVVEDLVQRDLWCAAPPPPPIAALAPEAPILTLGSMSKVFWGGLRIGWVRGDEATITRLARMKAVTDFGTPILPQVVATALLADVDRVAARRRAELTERLDVLTAALARHLPDWRADAPAGGLSLWAKLPEPRAEDLARHATAHGVAVVPGPTFAVGDTRHADRIRLPFVAAPAVIEEGVRRLAAAWESLAAPGAQRRTAALVV
jgi:DNA-binding transcriptional MocR family regulator